ncbi:MAG: hypothetical protein DME25_14280, partial [Verrucomicrobia bacterium]
MMRMKPFLARSMRDWTRLTAALWLLAAALTASTAAPATEKRSLMVPMRDGVKLATDVYLPATNGAFPVLFGRSPYEKALL